jgi:hypothetical protein
MSVAETAERLVAEVRDDPIRRMEFAYRTYSFDSAPGRYRPYAESVLAFMRWQYGRGVLNALDDASPGSPWWRAVNEHLLQDTYEARLLLGTDDGPSRPAVASWITFFEAPSIQSWYTAHNGSIIAGYLAHRGLADAETAAERFFMDVTLTRVLYAHAAVSDSRFALGRLAVLGRLLRNPRVRAPQVFLAMKDILPTQYPIEGLAIEDIVKAESRLGRILDHAVIGARLDALYAFAARVLNEPRVLGLVRDGAPAYAWPQERREVWESPVAPILTAVLGFLTGPKAAAA